MMTLGMLQKRKTTTTQTRIETRFKSFFVEPRDLFRDSLKVLALISSVRSSYSHPDLLLITTPLFQITPVLNTGLSLSEPLQPYKGYIRE